MILENDTTLVILKKLCKIFKIKKISHLTKKEIVNIINQVQAVNIIIKHYKKYLYSNKEDFISLETIKYPCFLWNSGNKLFFYNYDSIINYINKTGDTRDPVTRIQYSDTTLLRLDKEAKKYYSNTSFKFKSTYKIKFDVNYIKKIRKKRNDIASYEARINELLTLFRTAIQADILSWNLSETIIIDNIQYSSINNYIYSIKREYNIIINNLKHLDKELSEYYNQNLLKLEYFK